MATVGKGSKRKVYFTKSVGLDKEVKTPSSWKPGKSRNKYKPNK